MGGWRHGAQRTLFYFIPSLSLSWESCVPAQLHEGGWGQEAKRARIGPVSPLGEPGGAAPGVGREWAWGFF